jgi:hypothetical protein
VHLPSGLVVHLAFDGDESRSAPAVAARGAPLFSDLVELAVRGPLTVHSARSSGGERESSAIDVLSLELRDFHTLRAIATRLGWLAEEPVEIACRNCGETFAHAPCGVLELGPYADGELDDPELDATLDLTCRHPVPPIPLPGGVTAVDVELRTVTAKEALPLHRGLRRRQLVISPRVVAAMGIVALGPERDSRRIAEALGRCDDDAWGEIGDLFLRAHYPARLCSAARCPGCGARNDVDAPYDREFEPSPLGPPCPPSVETSNAEVFPDFDAFDAHARNAFARIAGDRIGQVQLVVDGGVPACDGGGEPLLGAYLPPGGEPSAPVGAAEVTLYYRTFRAVWEEEGAYDWGAEVDETLLHELEHHEGWRVGHDPMDDDERAEIAREHGARVGRRVSMRSSASALLKDIGHFVALSWPIWLIVAAATVAISVCGR